MRLGLDRVNKVGELDGILDEEHWDVVADDIPVALLGVELHGETADVPNGVGTAAGALDCRKSNEDRCLSGSVRQHSSAGDILGTLEQPESSEGTRSASMNHTLGNTFMIESVDLGKSVSSQLFDRKK